MTAARSSTIDALTGFCKRELAAVESYRTALESPALRVHTNALGTCLRSHEQRAEFFKSRIRALHAEPPSSAGVLGAFGKFMESAAAAIGRRMALAALEEAEDRLVRHYQAHLLDVDPESQELMQAQVIPAQFETHRLLCELARQRQLASPSP